MSLAFVLSLLLLFLGVKQLFLPSSNQTLQSSFFYCCRILHLDKSTKKQKSENHLSHPDILPTVLVIILEQSSILIFILQMAGLPLPSLKSKNTRDPLLTGSKTGILIILYSFMNIFRFLLSSPVFSPHRSPVLSTLSPPDCWMEIENLSEEHFPSGPSASWNCSSFILILKTCSF